RGAQLREVRPPDVQRAPIGAQRPHDVPRVRRRRSRQGPPVRRGMGLGLPPRVLPAQQLRADPLRRRRPRRGRPGRRVLGPRRPPRLPHQRDEPAARRRRRGRLRRQLMHRVLLVTENYPPDRGGMSESCDRIVRGLTRDGVAVEILHFDRRAARPELRRAHLRWPLEQDPAHTINCAWNRARLAFDMGAVTHVVAFGGYLPLLAAPAFAAWIDRPLVTLLRGNELDAGLFDPRRRPILADPLRRSAAVCPVTTAQADKVAALHGIEPRVIANGIDFDLWQPTEGDRVRSVSLRSDRRLLGFFGHLKAKKGVPFFLDALRRAGDPFRLLLVGEAD